MKDDEHYWRMLSEAWGGGMVVLEHDILAWGIRSLERCPEPWCVRPYMYGDRFLDYSLGLAKFNFDFEFPDLPYHRWDSLDGPLFGALAERGYCPHVHHRTWHAK